jgi:hypothetical protein
VLFQVIRAERQIQQLLRVSVDRSCDGSDLAKGSAAIASNQTDLAMWKWFNCYLSGRHEYGIWCEPGTMCLRCMHCGRRSVGWALNGRIDASKGASIETTSQPGPMKQKAAERAAAG